MKAKPDEKPKSFRDRFVDIAKVTSNIVGSVWAFLVAVLIVVVWATTGPIFKYSDTWQLVINTGTTIVTFLMVFLIQSTQNRDSKAIHLKLDELIRAHHGARNNLVDLESLSEEELDHLAEEFSRFRERAHKAHLSRKDIERTQERIEECADAEIGGTAPEECAR
jgi:low affinity Fe/Cu permease